jgi:hypothetical protein
MQKYKHQLNFAEFFFSEFKIYTNQMQMSQKYRTFIIFVKKNTDDATLQLQ